MPIEDYLKIQSSNDRLKNSFQFHHYHHRNDRNHHIARRMEYIDDSHIEILAQENSLLNTMKFVTFRNLCF